MNSNDPVSLTYGDARRFATMLEWYERTVVQRPDTFEMYPQRRTGKSNPAYPIWVAIMAHTRITGSYNRWLYGGVEAIATEDGLQWSLVTQANRNNWRARPFYPSTNPISPVDNKPHRGYILNSLEAMNKQYGWQGNGVYIADPNNPSTFDRPGITYEILPVGICEYNDGVEHPDVPYPVPVVPVWPVIDVNGQMRCWGMCVPNGIAITCEDTE